jgi:hypothetical protein
MCLNFVDAQMQFFRSALDTDSRPAFAGKIHSTPGRQDGLYWPIDASGQESPVGPRFAAAAAVELKPVDTHPYFGYYFKILEAQGSEAAGGARDYRVDGRLITGFALVAWPAEYGVTGVRSFLVSQMGEVFAKDLGSMTGRDAAAMTTFSPDRTWTKVATLMD